MPKFYFGMKKLPKIKIQYVIPGVIFLLALNYYFFQQRIEEQFALERTSHVVAAILQENNIEVKSTPAIYNIKDKEHIDFLTNGDIRNKALLHDQIVYYGDEKLIVLYRPEFKRVVTVATVEK